MRFFHNSTVVGYSTKAVAQAQWRLMTVQFESTSASRCVQDVMPCASSKAVEFIWDEETEDFPAKAHAVQLAVMNGDGNYDTYYYISNAYYGWNEDEENPVYYTKEGWSDEAGTLATPALFESGDAIADGVIPAGGAMWYVYPDASADEDIQTSGMVKTAKDVSIECPNIYMLRGNPYPTSFELNKTDLVQFSDITPVEFVWDDVTEDFPAKAYAPLLQVMNAEGNYESYYYISNAYYGWNEDEENPVYYTKEGWSVEAGTLATPALLESGDAVTDGVVSVNAGMWANSQGGFGADPFIMKFISPIK